MKTFYLILILFLPSGLYAQSVRIDNAAAIKLLKGMEKSISGSVLLDAEVHILDLGTSCSEGTHGKIDGDGNISANGWRDCRDRKHRSVRATFIVMDKGQNLYKLNTICDETWIWSNCVIPEKNAAIRSRLDSGRHSTFTLHIWTNGHRLGNKDVESKYAILSVSRIGNQ